MSQAFDELRFFSFEHVKTRNDARDRMVRFEISRSSPLLHYELRETPTGSLAPAVKSIEFQRELELIDAEADSIFKRLVTAGLFSLPESAEHRGEGNIWSLSGSLKDHKFELSYRRPPLNGARKQVNDTVKNIVREFGLDKVSGPAYARIIRHGGTSILQPDKFPDRTNPPAISESEGDLIRPRQTTLHELIRHAQEFDGKRVSVVGFYHWEFEGAELRAQEKSDEKQNLWCDSVSSLASSKVALQSDRWARVDGTFLKGPAGHFGMWPGELTRVTRFEIQTQPTISLR